MKSSAFRDSVERLGSTRTALVLLLALAGMAMAGTLVGPRFAQAPAAVRWFAFLLGLSDTFRSPAFIAAGALFAANIGVCTWRRTLRGRRGGDGRRRVLAWLDAGTHLALIIMILGGVGQALFGKVGTGYLFPQIPATVMSDPVRGDELPLGFAVVMRERRIGYYPLSLKIGVREAATDAKLGLLEVKEGGSSTLEGTDLALEILDAGADNRAVLLLARGGGLERSLRFSLKENAAETHVVGRYRLSLVAYRRKVRAVRARIEIKEGERTVREAWLEVNGGVEHRGTRISIIAWSNDQSDEEFLGVQYRRDPTAPLFWIGTIMLSALLPPFIVARRHRGSG